MSSRDSEEGESRTLWVTSALLPIPKGVDADAKRVGECLLGHTQENPQSDDIGPAMHQLAPSFFQSYPLW